MNKSTKIATLVMTVTVFSSMIMTACQSNQTSPTEPSETTKTTAETSQKDKTTPDEKQIQAIRSQFQNATPAHWGEKMPGIISKLPTSEKVIALTFDACGGKHGDGYDAELIQYLQENQIPATLFLNARWIESHPELTKQLANNPLFEIENHGSEHRPLSINGRSVYGIQGTQNLDGIIQEIIVNHRLIEKMTGRAPRFFRAGTAYYDDIAVQVAKQLDEQIAGFHITGDAGATFNQVQVKNAMLQAKPGSIILLHMNQPRGNTAEGIKEAIPLLKKQGYRFVKMDPYIPTQPS
ncbi:Peptidoglycan/xylan/chitin deacetylase, PgdA/CDA1 family [Thermoactinomyces sp. DSM 45891]|uniref:polysaccharide deacetylase family protein n=1 Tax=Thermoactinomyces sp. DSM 45891 TaxID=1761907 RepID=UPI000913ACAE|nr:polysaccharide deacetylase family protein [Thermoactinomyces sp. DSM 45891]SFX22792.1 Peptidoglycan/xylan/chitin deacetylase, PgdA/CDA1 family [Thermoactinomyces sp. DSM 45891]